MGNDRIDSKTYHELRLGLETARQRMDSEREGSLYSHTPLTEQWIDVEKYPEITAALVAIRRCWKPAMQRVSLAKRLGVSEVVFDRFLENKGIAPAKEAQGFSASIYDYLPAVLQPPPDASEQTPFHVNAVQWVTVAEADELSSAITNAIFLIGEVVKHLEESNLPPDARALTEMERAQLIVVLETALRMLKSPMIEKGLLRTARKMLKNVAEKAVEKQAELALSAAASTLGTGLGVLLSHL